MKEYKYRKDNGLVIEAAENKDLLSLNKEFLKQKLKENGYVLLRGFHTDIEKFSALVNKTSSKTTLDPARVFHSENTQKVDAGTQAVGLHIENGVGPVIPDFCWFYCRLAPDKGSQTTVCDGKLVYQNLPAGIKEMFLKSAITYKRKLPEKIWKTYISHELNINSAEEEINETHLAGIRNGIPGLDVKINADKTLDYSFRIKAILQHEEEHFFANSILGPSYNYEKPLILFDDGNLLSDSLKNNLEEITDQYTEDIDWEDGDIVMIDNKRVMHGRREIITDKREIFNALSFN